MSALDVGYLIIAIQPFGGILIAIPLGFFKLGYPVVYLLISAPLLAYLQVVIIDLFWSALERWPWFKRQLQRSRSARVERLMKAKGAFWPTFLATPLVGPWVVMAFMRYAQVPQRRVALPILLSLSLVTVLTTAACLFIPEWFSR